MTFVTLAISSVFYTLQPSTTNEGGALLISHRPSSERASLPQNVRAVVEGPAESPPAGGQEMGGGGRGGCGPPPARAEHREGRGGKQPAVRGCSEWHAEGTVAYARPHAPPSAQAARTAVTHTTARSRTPHRSCPMHTTPFAPAVITLAHVTAPRPSSPAFLSLPFSSPLCLEVASCDLRCLSSIYCSRCCGMAGSPRKRARDSNGTFPMCFA